MDRVCPGVLDSVPSILGWDVNKTSFGQWKELSMDK